VNILISAQKRPGFSGYNMLEACTKLSFKRSMKCETHMASRLFHITLILSTSIIWFGI